MKTKEARKKVRDYKGVANTAFLNSVGYLQEMGADLRHELYVFKFKVDRECRKMFRRIRDVR